MSVVTGALLAGSGVVLTAAGHEPASDPQDPDTASGLLVAVGLSRPRAVPEPRTLAAQQPRPVQRELPPPYELPGAASPAGSRQPSRSATSGGSAHPGAPSVADPARSDPSTGRSAAATQAGTTQAGTGDRAGTTPATPARTIMIIRHGEKPAGGGSGIDAAGRPDTHSLTSRGWQRASGIARLFAGSDRPSRPGLARPKTIFAAAANDQGEGTRTRETVGALAGRLGLPVNSSFGKGDEAALARQAIAASSKGPVLISWQHGEIPAIAEAFHTVGPPPPAQWPDSRYDMVWTLTDTGQGWKFSQVPEMVLPGDSGQTFR